MQTSVAIMTQLDNWESSVQRHNRVILLGIVLFATLLYALTFYPQVVGTDDTTYLIAARALASGVGLHWMDVQGYPPFTLSPPGYPLLLTPGAWLFPDPPKLISAAQLVGVLSALAFIPLIYWTLTRLMKLSALTSLLITLWMAVSTQTIYLAAQSIMSDPAYVVFSLVAIGLVERYQQSHTTVNRWWVLSAVSIAWVATLRTAGLPLVLAAVLYLSLRRQIRQGIALAAFAGVLLLPWTLWTAMNGATPYLGIYSEQFQMSQWLVDYRRVTGPEDIMKRVLTNAWAHVHDSMALGLFPTLTGPNVTGWMDTHGLGWVAWAIGLTISALALIGYVHSLGQKQLLIGIYGFFYVGLILLPPWVTPRNVYPIYPFLLAYMAFGADWIVVRWKPKREQWGKVGIWLVLGLMIVSSLVSDRHRIQVAQQYRTTGWSDWSVKDWTMPQAAEWIRANTSPDALSN